MSTAVKIEPSDARSIPFQEASLDIWDKKYRLCAKDGTPIDRTMDDTYKRVARALADVENEDVREQWYEQFLWALRRGAIPAGRVTSNAGAQEHKPATSTINCTVSGTIRDSMDDILGKVHEAGLTLKAGCGIGYEFSTLRPRGAYVSGAGAYTSGPLSFMDIYDKMCFTVSSAGGRRGAQMGTFDVGHPDAMEFIRAKREAGRLRQFNLSLLVTDEFMKAVREDKEWKLAFPVREAEIAGQDVADAAKFVWREWPDPTSYVRNDDGLVLCKVYKTLPARRLWDVIMSSTYDFAEPGFVLIDRVNEMNNNWWCENIRATNPCVTADTWVHTAAGPRQVSDLVGTPFMARVNGVDHAERRRRFFPDRREAGAQPRNRRGLSHAADGGPPRDARGASYARRCADRMVRGWRLACRRPGACCTTIGRRANGTANFRASRDTCLACWSATVRSRPTKPCCRCGSPRRWRNGPSGDLPAGVRALMSEAFDAAQTLPHRSDFAGWSEVAGRNEYRLSIAALKQLAEDVGMTPGDKRVTAAHGAGVERCSAAGSCAVCSTPMARYRAPRRKAPACASRSRTWRCSRPLQRMLLRLGMASCLYRERRVAGTTVLPDGHGGRREYATRAQHELVLSGANLARFAELIGFGDSDKAARLQSILVRYRRALNRERFTARVVRVTGDGAEAVYDVQVPGVNAFDANGLYAHNCGEQPLPPYGSCLLGSINLTSFVRDPFGDDAHFDWDEYRKVVRIFTRMLDNVVEVNGLPLEQQRNEIMRKRRHGMGFLGLGSTITMLRMKYGSRDAVAFTERVSKELAIAGWEAALDLAQEKGAAPIMSEEFVITREMMRKRPEMARDGVKVGSKLPGRVLHARYSRYMQRVAEAAPELVDQLAKVGARFTHHSSIAPTGTISLSLANNASNGIEPSFAHHYFRNVIREGRKTKERIDVFSFELLAYRELINANALPGGTTAVDRLPEYFTTAEDITPREHVDIQAASQKWIDSSISKTANVPTDYPYEDFKDIYLYAHEQGLKGCTTFRFNPEAFQGVLVKEEDLKNTTYVFTLEDGTEVEVKGDEQIEYDGETHSAANLFDALKEGYYGKF